jgi:hypothetical protein
MKKIILASLIATATCSSYAANTATLNVNGTLTMGACTPVLSDGGVIDYGNITLGDLSATEDNQMGSRDVTLEINCESPVKVGFTSIDNRPNTKVPMDVVFANGNKAGKSYTGYINGLGTTAEGAKIGAYGVKVKYDQALADGVSAQMIYEQSLSGSWTVITDAGAGVYFQEANIRTMTVGIDGIPVAFTTATIPLEVAMAIAPTDTLGITDEAILDGELTISMVYL